MAQSSMFSYSIGKKFAMALSAFFLLVFVTQHLIINLTSLVSEELFNQLSHFMGTNPLVQTLLQPVLFIGVIFHFLMGFALEIQNKKARGGQGYAYNKPNENSSWVSRNMLFSGGFILAFLLIHLIDFWIPEMTHKYLKMEESDPTAYFGHLQHQFGAIWRVILYIIGFIFLGLHLNHGFQSAFQSTGANHSKYTPLIKKAGTAFSVVVPALFIIIAVFHFIAK